MLVEIVTHCFSGPAGQYAHFLRFQIDGLLRHPPSRIEARLTVVYPQDDKPTADVLEEYRWPLERALLLNPYPMERGRALMRPIGRNERSLVTDADWVWHTDCDYVIHGEALDALCDLSQSPPLYFPATVYRCRDHATGDTYLGRVPPIETTDFVPHRERKAIGGIQIVPGDVARLHGYMKGCHKCQRPAPEGTNTVIGFEADAKFRRLLGTAGEPASLPGVYRLRHSVTGDDRAEKAGIVQP